MPQKGRYTDGKQHMKSFSTSSVSRKMKIKTRMRYHYIPILEWLKYRKQTIPIAGEDAEQSNYHSLLVGMQNGIATLEDSLAVSYKAKCSLTVQSSNCTPKYLPN